SHGEREKRVLHNRWLLRSGRPGPGSDSDLGADSVKLVSDGASLRPLPAGEGRGGQGPTNNRTCSRAFNAKQVPAGRGAPGTSRDAGALIRMDAPGAPGHSGNDQSRSCQEPNIANSRPSCSPTWWATARWPNATKRSPWSYSMNITGCCALSGP